MLFRTSLRLPLEPVAESHSLHLVSHATPPEPDISTNFRNNTVKPPPQFGTSKMVPKNRTPTRKPYVTGIGHRSDSKKTLRSCTISLIPGDTGINRRASSSISFSSNACDTNNNRAGTVPFPHSPPHSNNASATHEISCHKHCFSKLLR